MEDELCTLINTVKTHGARSDALSEEEASTFDADMQLYASIYPPPRGVHNIETVGLPVMDPPAPNDSTPQRLLELQSRVAEVSG